VVIDLPEGERLLAMPQHTVSAAVHQNTMMSRVFGAEPDRFKTKEERMACWEHLFKHVERMFVNDAISVGCLEKSNIPKLAVSLVSFQSTTEKQQRWEHGANLKVITPETSRSKGVVEADLLHLTRDFGTCVAVEVIYGKDFLQRNPTLLEDFWRFDNEIFILLVLGVPSWAPFSVMRNGVESRTRLQKALEGVYKRTDQYLKGEPVDFDADMSDISAAVKGRSGTFNQFGYTLPEQGQHDMGLVSDIYYPMLNA
jgi:hypothetical protein